jgi:imidazolonepropionase-like amidohydrolase
MARTVFTEVNLLDGHRAARPDQIVVVEGERITEIRSDAPSIAPDDRVIPLDGRTLMPGMTIGHWHPDYPDLKLTEIYEKYIGLEKPPAYHAALAVRYLQHALMNGFTQVVGAGCSHDIDSSMKMAIEEGVFEGPRIVCGSRHIDTTGNDNDSAPWWKEMGPPSVDGIRRVGAEVICDGVSDIRKAVRGEINRGAEIIKLFPTGGHGVVPRGNYRGMAEDEYIAAIEAAHQRNARVRAHCVAKPAILKSIDLGVDIIDHGDEIDGQCIEKMVKHGTGYIPSMLFLKKLREHVLAASGGEVSVASQEQLGPIEQDFENMRKMLPEANKAGVCIVPGDDYGVEIIPHVPGIYAQELAVYVEDVGIAAIDVLRWATVNGAALSQRSEDLGSIEVGKIADLLVVDGDPSADIRLLQDPERNLRAIMKGGRFVKDLLDQGGGDGGRNARTS